MVALDSEFNNLQLKESKNSIIAVKKIKETVLNAPMFSPILIITNISNAGIPIKNNNTVFICRFSNYINNVYLSNNE